MATFTCDYCGEVKTHDGVGTGYGLDGEGKKACYSCCASTMQDFMETHDRVTLYLVSEHESTGPRQGYQGPYGVTNWPGTLRFPATVTVGRHNMGLPRYDVWFKDHTGAWWWGVSIGDYTQLVHCRRLKHEPWCA